MRFSLNCQALNTKLGSAPIGNFIRASRPPSDSFANEIPCRPGWTVNNLTGADF